MDSLAALPEEGARRRPRRVEALPDRTLVMGVLNVTEDSFSDGGRHATPQEAVRHGLEMSRAGADIVDVGGESTRPDAVPVDPAAEAARVIPVVERLAAAGVVVSVDTKNASTARAAVKAGALIINDVSGVEMTDEMARVVAETGVHYVLMHSRGPVRSQDPKAAYDDAPSEVLAELEGPLARLEAAGVAREKIILDPGLGFSKRPADNWALLRAIPRFEALGLPVLIGASRKRFLGSLLAAHGEDRPVDGRDAATVALTAALAQRRVWAVRVHDVAGNADAVAVAEALRDEPARAGAGR
ncbi:dihydropteroate synthase [Falsarthrobacter nasiphocae]|uniref:Dihydropteroate synthase n=1 Tax=Falsarthrobacter nasiphocae TaxID=189863 RepID=A0AAE4C829_9MICC|nr:dihydropteroate synthase [Falsarthrobacter nasiphocae]MDR6891985.1 dihydropteroate synthase [Falsarthrobacter nasiphocae]